MFAMVAADSASKSVQVLEKLTKFIVSVLMCVQTKQVDSASCTKYLFCDVTLCMHADQGSGEHAIHSVTDSLPTHPRT